MTEDLKKTMTEEIAKLSKEKQEAINSIMWGDKVKEIGNKYLLTEDEINKLQLETGLFLLGLVDTDTYKSRVEDVIISEITTENITNETFEKVFKPIYQKIESSIKNNLKTQNIKWDQRVNFILSDGDYSNFIEQ
jgi:GTPase SAR1 family protein